MRRRLLATLGASLALAGVADLARAPAARAAASTGESRRMAAYEWALTQKGKPYQWGGTGPGGYDCSGLVYAAYRHEGIIIPRTTYGMLSRGVSSGELIRVPFRYAKAGDLAFYGSGHVELVRWVNRLHWTFGALAPGTVVGFHRYWPGSGWSVTAIFRVRGAG